MEKLKIQYWAIDRFIPYTGNPRKNDPHVSRMVDSIREFGFRIPVLAKSDGTVIDGHLRIKAARKIGMTELPVIVADGLSDKQIQAFRLMVNKSVSWSEWDNDLLKTELESLQSENYNLLNTGFDTSEINAIFANLESAEELQEEEIEIKPFKKTHVLLSFPPDRMIDIQPMLDEITKIDDVEYEQSSN